MKKYFVSVVCLIAVTVTSIQAQQGNTDRQSGASAQQEKLQLALKSKPPVADKTDLFEVTGIKRSIFTVSNTADGTLESYKHTKRITMELSATNNNSYEVVFYSSEEKVPLVIATSTGKPVIYYPIEMYESIRQKLEQSFAARKKIQLQVVEKTTGFREVSLIF